jgi:hypothetical protein
VCTDGWIAFCAGGYKLGHRYCVTVTVLLPLCY